MASRSFVLEGIEGAAAVFIHNHDLGVNHCVGRQLVTAPATTENTHRASLRKSRTRHPAIHDL